MIRNILTFVGRIIGVVLVVISIVGIGLAVGLGILGTRTVNQVTVDVYAAVARTSDSLGTVEHTLVQVQSTLASVNDLVATAGGTATNLGDTIDATGTSMDRVDNVSDSGVKEALTEEAIRCIQVGISKHSQRGGNRWPRRL